MNVKEQMMRLWKDTFHDSNEYINIVFNSYYNPDLCFTDKVDGEVISELMCVPYNLVLNNSEHNISCLESNNNFVHNNKSDNTQNNENRILCAYQCGLATKHEYRGRGIMSGLINEANKYLFENNYILSLLIPSDEYLKLYYKKFGYTPVTFVNVDRYVSEHIFKNNLRLNYSAKDNYYNIYIENKDVANLYDIKINSLYYKNENNNISDKLLEKFYIWFKELENYIEPCKVQHTKNDFKIIVEENTLSKGKILLITDKNSKPLGMLWCCNIEEDNATIQLLVSESEETELILLQSLKSFIPEGSGMTLRRYPKRVPRNHPSNINVDDYRKNGTAIKEQYALLPDPNIPSSEVGVITEAVSSADLQKSYAMVKILNVAEILKFAARLYNESEFSILINHDEFAKNEGLYVVKNGEVRFTPLSEISSEVYREIIQKCSSELNWFNISVSELASLLFRPKQKNFIIESAIAIPQLSINIALMLD